MQHVYSHGGNLGNECADHAAALGTFGLTSSHNVATCWIHRNFDVSVCLMAVTTPARSWNDCSTFEQMSPPQNRGLALFSSSGSLCFLCISRDIWSFVSFALSLSHLGSCFLKQVMDRLSSSASIVPSIDDFFEHNLWNPVLELLFLEQVTGMFASYLVEIDMAKIALSCHFALDLLCYKEEVLASAR